MKTELFSILLFIAIGSILFISCETITGTNGHVVDADTGLAIEDVEIVIYQNSIASDTIYTNMEGYYKGGRVYSCISHCPSIYFTFNKEGYKRCSILMDTMMNNPNINPENYTVKLHAVGK